MTNYSVGDEVVALKQIVESGKYCTEPYDPRAEKCQPGWCHAMPGSLGVVIHVTPEGLPTVLFYAPATSTLCLEGEIEKNGHTVSLGGSSEFLESKGLG